MHIAAKSKMNQKAYSILFCALLASTFVHEIRAKAADKPAFTSRVLERAGNSSENCELKCNYPSTTSGPSLVITVNKNSSLIAIYNGTCYTALVIDIYANLVGVFNGKNGTAVIMKLDTGEGVYIPSEAWVYKHISFQAYLASLKSLTIFFKISVAISFNVKTASSAILNAINLVLGCLITNISAELLAHPGLGIRLIIEIALKIIFVLNGTLKGLTGLIGNEIIYIKGDLRKILHLFLALGTIFAITTGTLLVAIKAGVILSFEAIAKARSGLHVFVILILALGAKYNLTRFFGNISVEQLFNLIANLGGNSYDGLDGIFTVIYHICAFINGKISLYVLNIILIQYLVYNSPRGQDLHHVWNETLSITLEAIEIIGVTGNATHMFKDLKNGTLVVGGCSISAIINILLNVGTGGASLLTALILVLLELSSIVAVSISLPTLLVVLIIILNIRIGIYLVIGLGIDIDNSIVPVSGGILAFILKSIHNLIQFFTGGNFCKIIVKMPCIGDIIKALSVAITAATNGKYNLEDLLNGSTLFQSYIKGLFQLVSGIYLGVNSKIIAEVNSSVVSCTSFSLYYGVNVSYALTSTAP